MEIALQEFENYFSRGILNKNLGLINSGKEACVFLGAKTNSKGNESLFAVKVFKDRNLRGFKNRANYTYDIIRSTRREARAMRNKSGFGRTVEEKLWVDREIAFLDILNKAKAPVPKIVATSEHSFVMEYFGEKNNPAPRLFEFRNSISNPQSIFDEIIGCIELFLDNNIVHGDLSAYNILYFRERIIIIDFPQAMDARKCLNVESLLERDIRNICTFFEKYGVSADPVGIFVKLWKNYCFVGNPASSFSKGGNISG